MQKKHLALLGICVAVTVAGLVCLPGLINPPPRQLGKLDRVLALATLANHLEQQTPGLRCNLVGDEKAVCLPPQ